MKLLYEKESSQKMIRVYDDRGRHLLLLENRDEIHSEYDPKFVMLKPVTEHYWNFLTLFGFFPSIKTVLILGLGAGTCARQLLHYRPELTIDGVELDPEVVKVGKKYFGLDTTKVRVHITDAISFLKKTKKKYDYIIVDAFIHGNLGRQFITTDFYRLVKSRLTVNGLVGINYLASKDWPVRLRHSLISYFRNCRQVGNPSTYNYVALASDQEYDFSTLSCIDAQSKRLKNFVIKNTKQV